MLLSIVLAGAAALTAVWFLFVVSISPPSKTTRHAVITVLIPLVLSCATIGLSAAAIGMWL